MVHHAHAAAGDRAHRQLLLPRHAELADDEDVERRAECRRDAMRHWHAASRQAEDNDVIPPAVSLGNSGAEEQACLDAVAESIAAHMGIVVHRGWDVPVCVVSCCNGRGGLRM